MTLVGQRGGIFSSRWPGRAPTYVCYVRAHGPRGLLRAGCSHPTPLLPSRSTLLPKGRDFSFGVSVIYWYRGSRSLRGCGTVRPQQISSRVGSAVTTHSSAADPRWGLFDDACRCKCELFSHVLPRCQNMKHVSSHGVSCSKTWLANECRQHHQCPSTSCSRTWTC